MTMAVLGLSGCAMDPDYPGFHKPPVAGGGPDMGAPLRVAEASLRGGDAERAIDIYQTLSRRYPERIDLRLDLAKALMEAGAFDAARAAFAEVLVKDTGNATAQIGLGRVALKQYRQNDAETAFRSVLAHQPADDVARNGLAVALDLQGRHADSEPLYRQLLADAPTNTMARNNLGLCLTMQGRYTEAINVLLDAASAPMAPADARHNLSLAYGLSGNLQAAREIDQMDLPATEVRANQAFYAATRGIVTVPPVAIAEAPTPNQTLGQPGVYPGVSHVVSASPGVAVKTQPSAAQDIAAVAVATAVPPPEPLVQEASSDVLLSVRAGIYPGSSSRTR